jgi:hypothetical protein
VVVLVLGLGFVDAHRKVGVLFDRFEACSTFARVAGCRIAESLCDSSVSKALTISFPPHVASMATGWSDPGAGWGLHPLKINTFCTAHTMSGPRHAARAKAAATSQGVLACETRSQ